ncbi:TRAP transporter small permease [Fusobacterium sp. PH5-44]|uniref:TRAP transporter small permease n=1 Tax=unclassified Fusobacterium TaxID=2648384 RepID=UPI003D1D1478
MNIIKWLDEHLEEYILFILLVIMTVIMGVQITARFIFKSSLSWSEELVRYLFVWSAFIGVPYCVKRGTSVKVDQFRNMLPVSIQKGLLYIDKIIIGILFAIIVVYGFKLVKITYGRGTLSPALEIKMWKVQASILVGGVLTFIRNLQNFIKLFTGEKEVIQKHGL